MIRFRNLITITKRQKYRRALVLQTVLPSENWERAITSAYAKVVRPFYLLGVFALIMLYALT